MKGNQATRLAAGAAAFIFTLAILFTGCGGSGSMNNSTMLGGAQMASLQFRLGDSPADGVVAFEITVNSVVLNGSGGSTANLLPAPSLVELTHTAGTTEPLVIANVPRGTYSSATVTVSNPEVTVINPQTGRPQELTVSLSSATVTVNFNPALTVDAASSVVNFDFDLANSITISGNTATVNPMFTVTVSQVNQQEDDQDAEDGEVEDLRGAVTSTSTSSFMISGFNQPINVNSSTEFEGVAGIGQLTMGMLVEIDGVTQPDGSILAKKVEAEVEDGVEGEHDDELEAEGIVTSVTGNPVTQFQVVTAEQSAAPSLPAPALGSAFTVNVDANTTFSVDQHRVDLSNLPFSATFDATTLGLAQRVEAETDSANASNITATKVRLKVQALSGTASNVSGSGGSQTFTLTVAADSAFALLTGQTTINVFLPSGTEIKGMSSVTAGSNVRVRGLLFFTGSSYNLVASRIVAPESN